MADEKELEELEKVKQNLEKAKQDHSVATKEVLENANEFSRMSEGDAVLEQARAAQMLNSKKWYQFWEKATKIPKDNKYETYTSNERRTWKSISKANEDFLREVMSENSVDGLTWTKVSSKNGVTVTYCPEKSEVFKTRMYKLETTVADITPKLLLLGLVRGPVIGAHDEAMTYFREHYNFVGGKTSLVHVIKQIAQTERITARDFFDLTHWTEDEDGSIFYTASSVKAFPQHMKGIVRGATLFKGVCFKPTESGATQVTMVSQVNPFGWAPHMMLNWYVPTALVAELQALIAAAKAVKIEGNDERYVRKFVMRELDVQ